MKTRMLINSFVVTVLLVGTGLTSSVSKPVRIVAKCWSYVTNPDGSKSYLDVDATVKAGKCVYSLIARDPKVPVGMVDNPASQLRLRGDVLQIIEQGEPMPIRRGREGALVKPR